MAVSGVLVIDLQWIRGHVQYGGNKRVDRISKAFASVANNNAFLTFSDDFPTSSSSRCWDPGFPLHVLPLCVFLHSLPVPPPILDIPAGYSNERAVVQADSITHATIPVGVIAVSNDGEEAKAQATVARKRVKIVSIPTRRSARISSHV